MKIEHMALLVHDPMAVARWYERHLGMRVVRTGGAPSHTTFVADASGGVMLELYRKEALTVPDYRSMDPLVLHVAFAVGDVASERARLVAAGATPVGDVRVTEEGDQLAMLRDPWGFAIQLAHRRLPMRR